MKNISKLLEKEKWEIKSLGDIAIEVYSGNEVTKAQLGTGDYPAIRYSELFGENTCIEACINQVNPDLIQSKRYCEYGDLLISKISENERDIGKSATYLGSEKPIIGNNILLVKHNQNPKFLAYILTTKKARKQLKNMARPSTVFCLYPKHIKQLKIPLPPRHIQDLIADYLDHWTDLEQELEKELADRKKQYQHYKELILISERDKWETTTIFELAKEIYSGNEVTKSQLGTGNYPAIRYSEIHNSHICITTNSCFVNPELIKNKNIVNVKIY